MERLKTIVLEPFLNFLKKMYVNTMKRDPVMESIDPRTISFGNERLKGQKFSLFKRQTSRTFAYPSSDQNFLCTEQNNSFAHSLFFFLNLTLLLQDFNFLSISTNQQEGKWVEGRLDSIFVNAVKAVRF